MHYEERAAKTILTQTGGFLNGYTHSLNPYEGCAFGGETVRGPGCPFCYVRELPIAKFAGRPWGSWVRAKINASDLIPSDIARFARKRPDKKLRIFMSSSTDPYQGAEARLRLSRRILESLSSHLAMIDLLVVQTRSPLVERDLDLFRLFGDKIWLSLTIETDDENVRKQFTPTSPSLERLKLLSVSTRPACRRKPRSARSCRAIPYVLRNCFEIAAIERSWTHFKRVTEAADAAPRGWECSTGCANRVIVNGLLRIALSRCSPRCDPKWARIASSSVKTASILIRKIICHRER
jgi:hypothetical protein